MDKSDLSFICDLEIIVRERIANPSSESYTATLAAAGTQRIAQKVGEEGVELALAAVSGQRQEVIGEAADLLYHLIVLLTDQEITLGDVDACLASRHSARQPQN